VIGWHCASDGIGGVALAGEVGVRINRYFAGSARHARSSDGHGDGHNDIAVALPPTCQGASGGLTLAVPRRYSACPFVGV